LKSTLACPEWVEELVKGLPGDSVETCVGWLVARISLGVGSDAITGGQEWTPLRWIKLGDELRYLKPVFVIANRMKAQIECRQQIQIAKQPQPIEVGRTGVIFDERSSRYPYSTTKIRLISSPGLLKS
jgi:hypothetical protein